MLSGHQARQPDLLSEQGKSPKVFSRVCCQGKLSFVRVFGRSARIFAMIESVTIIIFPPDNLPDIVGASLSAYQQRSAILFFVGGQNSWQSGQIYGRKRVISQECRQQRKWRGVKSGCPLIKRGANGRDEEEIWQITWQKMGWF